ncbi:MAG: class I SAM-dependent methyltransferase [Bacteroidetes bacterium]|nr:MAG: class I SAM-dependent methyltransferase [Bacteroidota bacterium]
MMDEIFYEIFNNLPRQGPGDVCVSLEALKSIPFPNSEIRMADIGCGTGFQTLYLAQHIKGSILAVDNYQPYLDELKQKAEAVGLDSVIKVQLGDMNALELPAAYFDVLWSEGAVYIMGMENGLKNWRKFIKPQGYIVFSDVCWLKPNPPKELVDFWYNEVPGMMDVRQIQELIKENDYTLIREILLPASSWVNNYYYPLSMNVARLRIKYLHEPDKLEVIESIQYEIDIFHKYSDYYSYKFFVVQSNR